jgi:hypothetical protein
MAAAKKRAKKQAKVRDWKLVLADIRRTEHEVADLQDGIAEFRETLDLAKKRLAFIRTCIEKRAKVSATERRR